MSIPTNEEIKDLSGNGESTNDFESNGNGKSVATFYKFLVTPDVTRTLGEDVFKHQKRLDTNQSELDVLLMETGDIYKLVMQNFMLADELEQLKHVNLMITNELKDLQETLILTSFESPDIKKRIEEMDLEDDF